MSALSESQAYQARGSGIAFVPASSRSTLINPKFADPCVICLGNPTARVYAKGHSAITCPHLESLSRYTNPGDANAFKLPSHSQVNLPPYATLLNERKASQAKYGGSGNASVGMKRPAPPVTLPSSLRRAPTLGTGADHNRAFSASSSSTADEEEQLRIIFTNANADSDGSTKN